MPEVTCSIDGCERGPFARGWCSMHYFRWKRHGTPNGPSRSEHIAALNKVTKRTHGHATVGNVTPTFTTWAKMLQRCENPNHVAFPRYGGRGITVCQPWHDFDTFLTDMGERPDGKTLDRIDSNGNYEPSNCRWATAKQQAANRRPRK